ncbi:MAG: hypothetical protein R2733_11540 [Acidimicrobiales bacterium]
MSTSSSPSTPISRSGRRMAFAGSLLAGGIAIGAVFSPIGMAGAQDDSTPTSTVEATSERPPRPGGDHARRPGLAGGPEFLAELLDMTPAELREARDAGQTLAETAAAQGVSEAELVAALVDEATSRLDAAVAEGRLDADRAADMSDGLEERIAEMVQRTPEERPTPGEGRRLDAHPRMEQRLLGAPVFDELGLDPDALHDAIDGGSTLAEAAAAQGVGADELAAALTAAAEERLADAVADGKIDAEKAAEIQARIAERVQAHLDGPPPGD